MISFNKEFQESNGKPVAINGVTYHRTYEIKVKNLTHVNITVQSVKKGRDAWKQAVHLNSDKPLRSEKDQGNDFVFWFPTATLFRKAITQASCDCTPNSTLTVWNVWQVDNAIQSLYNGSAMVVTQLSEHQWQFQCNDGKPNDDMDDLVFTLELTATGR